MGTRVRDLQGQRQMVIDAREDTVFLDADGFCYEFDKGILLKAFAEELIGELECYDCKQPLVSLVA